jgi:Domain of unknown function (DUF4328)
MRPDSSSGSDGRFVPLGWRSVLVQVGLIATIVLDAAAASLVFVDLGLVADAIAARPIDMQELQDTIDRATAVGAISIGALALTAVAWWVWQYRGQANLSVLDRRGLDHGKWGAVGWWLMPIGNLWKPFQTMRELWKASEPLESPSEWMRVSTWPVLGWWWALWIVGNLLQWASGFGSNTTDLETIRTADFLVLTGLASSVFAACLAIGVVRQITQRQSALSALLSARASVALAYPPPRPDLG